MRFLVARVIRPPPPPSAPGFFEKKKVCIFYLMCVYYMYADAHGGQKRAPDGLEFSLASCKQLNVTLGLWDEQWAFLSLSHLSGPCLDSFGDQWSFALPKKPTEDTKLRLRSHQASQGVCSVYVNLGGSVSGFSISHHHHSGNFHPSTLQFGLHPLLFFS